MTSPPPGPRRSRQGRRLSLVAPMYNEAEVLEAFFARASAAAAGLGMAYEIICVDDGSRDATLGMLIARCRADPHVKVLALSRNFGKENALTAGLEAARGDLVVPIDADLQDPPELIAAFVEQWEAGYDVVYGVRADRQSDSLFKRATAGAFYRLFNVISDTPIPPDTGDFRLMDRAVVTALARLPERNRFMKGLFAWVGFPSIGVAYTRPARRAGVSAQGARRLWRLAVDGVTSFTSVPLRIWTGVGLTVAVVALAWAAVIVGRTLILGRDVPGYASLMVVTLTGLALQLIAFGILGEYVGRLYQEVKGRPVYITRASFGFDDDEPAEAPRR